MPALLVVDMQEEFKLAHSVKLQREIVRQIQQAKTHCQFIAVLEYEDSGETVPRVLKALKGYTRVAFARKEHDNGALEAARLLRNFTRASHVRVCGVATAFCVQATVLGLQRIGFQPEVWVPGTASWDKDEHLVALQDLAHKGVLLRGAA